MSESKRFRKDINFEDTRRKPIKHASSIRECSSKNGKEDKFRNKNVSELFDFHSSLTGQLTKNPFNRSSISNESIFGNSNKLSSLFQNKSTRDESPTSIGDGSQSPRPSLIQPPQNDNFDDFSIQYLENSMPIFVNELPFVSLHTTSDDVNKNYVTSQESKSLQVDPALTALAILDESVMDQEEGEMIESHSEKSTDSQLNEELSTGDIDKMLDEGTPENLKSSGNKECSDEFRLKVVVDNIGNNHFELLPEGWVEIMHASGMPVYLDKKNRICTMARPYLLGPGSSRYHNIPLSAIPCLHYQRATELEKKNKDEWEKKIHERSLSEIEQISGEVETFEEHAANQSLEPSELHDYCKRAFKFRTLKVLPLKSWSDKRKNTKKGENIKNKKNIKPNQPKGTKVVKFPIKNPDGTVSESKGEWVFNPNGKSYIHILQEYVQTALKKHLKYQFQEVDSPATPYSATVFIENIKCGFGIGASKKKAKLEAAKAALDVLLPGIKNEVDPDCQFGMKSAFTEERNDNEISFFDHIKVEDTRVTEYCAKSAEPSPYAILLTCLSRNSDEIVITHEINPGHQDNECTLTIGKYSATVPCRNKLEGKERAAQAILKQIYPTVTYWSSLLQMYGNRSIKELENKNKAEEEITQSRKKATINRPNFAVLNKLRTEMLKLRAKREAVKNAGPLPG